MERIDIHVICLCRSIQYGKIHVHVVQCEVCRELFRQESLTMLITSPETSSFFKIM